MKVKVFNIRIADKHLEHDQNQVNNFLSQVEMKKSASTLVTAKENFWSLLIHYKELSQEADAPQENAKAVISPTLKTQSKPKKRKESPQDDHKENVSVDSHKPKQKPKPEKSSLDDLTKKEINLLDNLKSWRGDRAQKDKVPPFVILWDQHLIDVIKAKPTDAEELMEVKGFSANRVKKYGDEILGILNSL